MMLKKLLTISLALAMAFAMTLAFTACGGSEEPAEEEEQEVPIEESAEEAAGPKMSALSRLESIREEDDSDDSANHQLNINADDDLGIELEVVEN